MLSADDLVQMRENFNDIRADNPASIVLRRGSTTLPAQEVRITQPATGRARRMTSESGEQAEIDVIVAGDTLFDVQKDDRFTLAGQLYTITFVRPNRTVNVTAEATAVQ